MKNLRWARLVQAIHNTHMGATITRSCCLSRLGRWRDYGHARVHRHGRNCPTIIILKYTNIYTINDMYFQGLPIKLVPSVPCNQSFFSYFGASCKSNPSSFTIYVNESSDHRDAILKTHV